jgi:hypothetical protein
MKRIPIIIILGLLFLLLSPPVAGMASVARIGDPGSPEINDLGYSQMAIGPDTLFWRTGTLLYSASPSYLGLPRRNPTAVARFQSNNGVNTMFYVLGAVARPLRVADIKVYLLSLTGSYSGNATIELWAYSMAGAQHHRISQGSLDMESTSTGVWQTISLSATPSNRLLAAGQSLVVAFDLSGAAGGSLDIYSIYEAVLTTHTTEIYLPMIRK